MVEVILDNNLDGKPLVLNKVAARLIAEIILSSILKEMNTVEGGGSSEIGVSPMPEAASLQT
jgi:hypothetical protein